MVNRKLCSILAAVAASLSLTARAAGTDLEIPYQKFVLGNGLTLIVHEDHKAPIVAVNVWYHVGSKNEKPGKTGFAHLFEHLMFNGSEHYNDDYFKPFDRVGATDMNGTTNFDRTNYFQNVPATALETALWMESDRMGHLLGAIDQARLDEQRGVVQNEKRQGENQPYGQAFRLIFENTYPQGHPYSWSVIGSMEDLDRASLDDVHQWFKSYYGAANAVVVVAGDVETAAVRGQVERYFGDIPAGPPVTRQEAWAAPRTGTHRQVLQDRVPQSRIYKAWNIPEWDTVDSDLMDHVANLFASGKNSRLYRRLVYRDQTATDVAGFAFQREMGGLLIVFVTCQPGQETGPVERAMDEELARLLASGPTAEELKRVKAESRAEFVRGIERIGGFGGKSDILAMSEVYGGRPDAYKVRLDRLQSATAEQVQSVARRWLADGAFVLEVQPFPEYATVASNVDRSKLPETASWPEVRFPARERAKLSNGLQLIVARRDAVPVVDVTLVLDAGYAADQLGVAGAASLAMNMLDEGTTSRSALQISEELAALGAELTSDSNLDNSFVRLSALKDQLDSSLDLFADVILHPAFSAQEFERLKKETLASIQREKTQPMQMALRVLPKLLYTEGHAYGLPFTGSGTEQSVGGMTRDDLVRFHQAWFSPAGSTLVVVGDTTLAEIRPKLERLFQKWTPKEPPKKNIASVPFRSAGVYIVDRPGSIQSMIFAGHVAPPERNPDEVAIQALNEVLGAGFSARINMNLREDKHWSYGARSVVVDARGQRPFFVYAPVQSDKTMEAMREIRSELTGIVGSRPPTQEEVDRAKDKRTLTLPGRWETARAVSDSILELVRFDLPEDHWDAYPAKVRALGVADVSAAAKTVVQPDQVVWVVVGDREKIESGIRSLELGELRLIDADGKPVDRPALARN